MCSFINDSIFDPGKPVEYDSTGASLDVVDRCLGEITKGDGDKIFAESSYRYRACHRECLESCNQFRER